MFIELVSLAFENLLFFALHLESGGVFPKPLSASEEEECFRKMHDGDTSARNKLIEHNLRLVAHIIKKYYNVSTDQEDLISIGTIGLIKAVSTFDYSKKTRFATYASRCIENVILPQWLFHVAQCVHLPLGRSTKRQMMSFISSISQIMEQ